MPKYDKETLKGIYQRITGAMSGLSTINVRLEDDVCPYFDAITNTIVLPYKVSFAENDEEDFIFGRGICVHEDSHVLFLPNINDLRDLIGRKDPIEWMNVFADVNNEYKVTEIWPHLKQPLVAKTRKMLETHPEIMQTDNPFMQVLMRIDALDNIKAEFPKGMDPDIQQFVLEVADDFKKREMHRATGSELVEFTIEVSKKWDKFKQDFQQQMKFPANIGDLQKALGQAIKDGDAVSQKQIQEAIKKALAQKKKWYKDDIDSRLVSPAIGGYSGRYANEDLETLKKMIQKSDKKICVGIGEKGMPALDPNIVVTYPESMVDMDLTESYRKGKIIHNGLKKRVKLQQDYERRQRSGRIDFNEIRKQVGQMGQICHSAVFERPNTFNRGGEWACQVLIDCSGSMQRLMEEAKQALATLAYALNGLPNVRYELLGFSTTPTEGKVLIVPIKLFNERRLKPERLKSLTIYGGTPTGMAINYAARRLAKNQMRKIMIVITDGEPDNEETCKESIQRAEKMGIKTIGIYLGGNEITIKQYFKNYYVLNNADIHRRIPQIILSSLGQRERLNIKRTWKFAFQPMRGGGIN